MFVQVGGAGFKIVYPIILEFLCLCPCMSPCTWVKIVNLDSNFRFVSLYGNLLLFSSLAS